MRGFSRVGCTRFVSATVTTSASGSHHKLVPVKPRCPKVRGPAVLPTEEPSAVFPSNPQRKEPPARGRVRRMSSSRPRKDSSRPAAASSSTAPNFNTASAVANRPACPAAAWPAMAQQLASATAPRVGRRAPAPRQVLGGGYSTLEASAGEPLTRGTDVERERREELPSEELVERGPGDRFERRAHQEVAHVAVDGRVPFDWSSGRAVRPET